MRRFVLYILVALSLSASARDIVVLDSIDSSPVTGATAFDSNGTIIGLSDAAGKLTGIPGSAFPLTLRCLGYASLATPAADTVRLAPVAYPLRELTVIPGGRPVTRLVCYVREYGSGSTSTDTVRLQAEYMVDYFIAEGKARGFSDKDSPRKLSQRIHIRHTDASGRDTSYTPDDDEGLSWLLLAEMSGGETRAPQSVIDGAPTDTVRGRSGYKTIYRRTPGLFTVTSDALADKKNHRMSPFIFKMLGFTIDINELVMSEAYAPNPTGVHTLSDLRYKTLGLRMLAKGKWIKKAFGTSEPIDMHGLIEIYPVETTRLTVDEARELRSDPPPTPVTPPSRSM